MLGNLKLPLNSRQYFMVFGGPYMERPEEMKGVKMAIEIERPCSVNIPTHDFQVPDKKLLYRGLDQAVKLILAGEPVYVGCMGGKGRTGLFLAVLAKAFGVRKPIEFVRKNYYSHAVETSAQMDFVKNFKIAPQVHIQIKKARRRNWWKFWRKNLTRISVVINPAGEERYFPRGQGVETRS